MSGAPGVRRQSIRVALSATLVVAVVYFAIAAGVIAYATRDLTAQVDQRLTEAMLRVPPDGTPGDQPDGTLPSPGRDPGRPYGAPFLVWIVMDDGTVVAASTTPALPDDLVDVTTPVTATIDGTAMRVAGGDVADGRLVVAQSAEQVGDAQRTIVVGVLLIAPFLLGFVFAGAVLIGRRVAEPIEAARRRQLEFTADASHELRTPLSVIEAHTSLALAQDRDTDWYRGAFGRIDRESKRMRRLLEDMLWLARFDAAAPSTTTGPVDLGVLATHAADRFAAVAETRRLRLGIHVPAGPVLVTAPPDLLDRLVGVLLDNACKYAPEEGTVDLTVSLDGSRATVTVDDSGPGIAPEDEARIFDRFHRSLATAGDAGGAGLGLAIGETIVRATAGRWTVGRSPSGGARFAVTWSHASPG